MFIVLIHKSLFDRCFCNDLMCLWCKAVLCILRKNKNSDVLSEFKHTLTLLFDLIPAGFFISIWFPLYAKTMDNVMSCTSEYMNLHWFVFRDTNIM